MLRIIGKGVAAGVLIAAAIALLDVLWKRGDPFGLLSGILGILTGFLTLLLAFGMAMSGYMLASRNLAPALRKRLVLGAVWAGTAGMTCGFASALLWLAAGRPWFV